MVVVDPRYISDFSCYRGFQEPVGSNISVINWLKNFKDKFTKLNVRLGKSHMSESKRTSFRGVSLYEWPFSTASWSWVTPGFSTESPEVNFSDFSDFSGTILEQML